MKTKFLLTMVVASLLVGMLSFGCVPVEAYTRQIEGSTVTGTGGVGGISGSVKDMVDAIDDIFGIFVGSPNLNNMLRNLSAAMAVFVQHSMNEVVAALHFALYVILLTLILPIPSFTLGIITFIVIGIIGVLRSVVDALATFTRVY